MNPKIFVLGATGYLGGDILHVLLDTQPGLESAITCLVRSYERGEKLKFVFPAITVVYGGLDDREILEREAAKADIVLSVADCDHEGAHWALRKGLEQGKGGVWIHAKYHAHAPVDQILLSTNSDKIKTAIVRPPTIWGVGRGTGNTRSHQLYELAAMTLSRGAGLQIPDPKADELFWHHCHVYDVSDLFMVIINAAIGELERNSCGATWGVDGYYFCVQGRFYWQRVARWISREAARQGFIESAEVKDMEEGEEKDLEKVGVALWNWTSDCKSIMGGKIFGWEPGDRDLKGEIPAIVSSEAERLGIEKKF